MGNRTNGMFPDLRARRLLGACHGSYFSSFFCAYLLSENGKVGDVRDLGGRELALTKNGLASPASTCTVRNHANGLPPLAPRSLLPAG